MDLNNVSQSLRLREYYYMFLRHKAWFFIVVLVSVIVATAIAYTQPKVYQSETVLLVEDEKILNPLIKDMAITPALSARMRTLREELLSWQRLTLLVEKLKLDKDINSPLGYERLIQNLRQNINIKMKGNALISVTFEGEDPQQAQDIVRTLAEIIIDGNLTSVDLEANSAIRFIQDQLSEYRAKLEESERDLRDFREVYESVLPVATRMNEQLVALKIELSNLLVDNTEAHPRVQQTRKLISQIEEQRNEFMRQAQESGVDIAAEDFAKLITSVPLQQQHLAKLQRDYFVRERVYQQLSGKLETAKISQTLENSDSGTKFRILEPARLPLIPIKPNKPLFVLGGLGVGIALAGLVIYLIELNNTSIKNLEEAKRLLDLPIFGAIPTILPEELMMGERLRAEAGV